jgi:histidinol-phosphate aminotransferase
MTGANHVLPTGGLARAFAGLSTGDFLRWMTFQELTPEAAAAIARPTAVLAGAEGLPGHAAAAGLRAAAPTSRRRAVPERRPDFALRPAYAAVDLYDPGRRPCPVDLSDNTNLFGPSPAVMETLATMSTRAVTRYPGVYVSQLKEALARVAGVPVECITTGCGSDDVIDSAMRAFLESGDSITYPEPTFGIIPTFARMNAAVTRPVPLGPDYTLDVDALAATNARLTYLCRPNNPTGTQFDRAAVETVVERAAGVVLIDEAYADFAGEDLGRWAAESDRAIVLRTLSKAYGLAGLRVGYAVGPPRLIAEIEKSRGPYKVGGVAEAAALAVISRDLGWVRGNVAAVRENRTKLASQLGALGLRVWRSAANFVLVELPPELGGARECADRLRERGVAVRPFEAVPQAGECLRVSVGPWPMMEAFIDALAAVRSTRGAPTGRLA